jgi:hypothetical protein
METVFQLSRLGGEKVIGYLLFVIGWKNVDGNSRVFKVKAINPVMWKEQVMLFVGAFAAVEQKDGGYKPLPQGFCGNLDFSVKHHQ